MSYAVHMNVTGARRGTSLQAFKISFSNGVAPVIMLRNRMNNTRPSGLVKISAIIRWSAYNAL